MEEDKSRLSPKGGDMSRSPKKAEFEGQVQDKVFDSKGQL